MHRYVFSTTEDHETECPKRLYSRAAQPLSLLAARFHSAGQSERHSAIDRKRSSPGSGFAITPVACAASPGGKTGAPAIGHACSRQRGSRPGVGAGYGGLLRRWSLLHRTGFLGARGRLPRLAPAAIQDGIPKPHDAVNAYTRAVPGTATAGGMTTLPATALKCTPGWSTIKLD